MSVELTPEQHAAVARRDGSLFVRAGAGSGKTRVLVERFVAAVREDGVAVDRILAITFTEKAAAELRTRVRERLLATGDREGAREAEAAAISTIHGFCGRLLRGNALAAGLDPEFRVLDETDAARLALDAFDAAFGTFLEEAAGDDQLDLAARYLPDRLRAMVTTVHGRLRSQGKSQPRLPPVAVPSAAGERERLERAIAGASAELGAHDGTGKRVDAARTTLESCGRLLGGLADGATAEPDELAKLAVGRGNVKALKTPKFEELAEAHAAYLAFCEAGRAAADHALLARLLELYDARYSGLKDARSALDFEDLELRARDLLRDDPALGAAVRGRYAQVMVDEFQDTNQLQNDIVDLIADGNLFAVGDDRQSIYGFRHADVGLFRDRGARAEEEGRAAGLRTNFRTRPEVLAALNAAFGPLWADAGYEALLPAPGAGSEPAHVDPSVELLLVDRSKPRWEEALGSDAFGTGAGETIWRGAEARLLAQRIDELAGPGRPFEYGDVAILLRAATDIALFERALVERGIPAYSHGGRGFSEAQQVGDLRAYLAALANPLDELALTMLLASPLAGVSLGSIASVRLRARALRRDLWWALEQAFGPGGDGSDGLADALPAGDRERLAAFVERFARQRAEASRLSLETVVDRAVTESGYDRVVLAMAGGERRLANVRKLMRLARRFEAETGRDLRRFIDHLDEREELRAHEGEAPVEGARRRQDAPVRLMTVHAAKGLEFPVVCLADLGRPTRGGDDAGLRVAEDGSVGLRLASMSGERRGALEWERLEQEQNARAEEEERRIFYVAMTRAQEHLVLSGATDLVKWPEPQPLREPVDWIWRAVAPGAKDLAEDASTGVDERETEWGRLSVGVTLLAPGTADDVLPPAARRPAAEPSEDDGAVVPPPRPDLRPVPQARPLPVGRLSYSSLESYRRCAYRYYLERVAGLGRRDEPALVPAAAGAGGAPDPSADGDGQLVLALDDAAAPPPSEAEGISPMLRGSIVHELLERLDMRAPVVPDADAIAARLGAHGVPSDPGELARVTGLIEGFAGSALRQRIAAAKRVRVELPFAFELASGAAPPVLVNGFLDVYAEEADGVLIVDYKTDPLGGDDPTTRVERGYTTQRLVYALAALRSGAPRVEVAYCFLEAPERPVAAVFEAADADELERQLVELAAGVLGGEFVPTGTPNRELCWTCPGRESLCIHGPERTLSEPPTAGIRSEG